MAKIEILPTTPEHIIELRENLREEDVCEILHLGLSVRKALWRSYRESIFCKTALVNGKVASIWGLRGILLGEVGEPWFLTSNAVYEVSSLTFARIYRREVQKMLEHFPVLENYVDAGYTKSVRLLELTGFTLEDPKPIWWLKSKALFRKFRMVEA